METTAPKVTKGTQPQQYKVGGWTIWSSQRSPSARTSGFDVYNEHGHHAGHCKSKKAAVEFALDALRFSGPCTVKGFHCENCGRLDPGMDEGYTGCCNELSATTSDGYTDCRNHHGNW